ncbi:MAG: coproporphyrinogen oxidase, oxygen-independent [Hydrocarboniphaga sp.]|uniref:oxygen-independent coproporphyrinogen III oxidase n=1 Tax=Hydrocarboniphaga sp. TaxID=2033016 RepID=UPI00261CCF02|nr:oxygen-independent coproporphyrinogen III oxidase [Hydrocarboniphaga sp.]MDB5971349.1 coproporphyrinogen oxidase, oxygen-independent [Hydrocarboniphaga sp.]
MLPMTALPADLLARELRGPRYTSYPTALAFGPQFGVADYIGAARELARHADPLSLYFHVPFCASNCYYCGCNRVVTRNRERIERYFVALLAELKMHSALLSRGPEVVQIHFGGGTPNMFSVGQFARLLAAIHQRLRVAESGRLELSMEVDPRLAEASDIYSWRALGFNRLSFGVQDVNDSVQLAINRVQSRERIAELTACARRAGFSSINYDLVYGLPLQTPARLAGSLDFVIEQRPERIAAYHYAHLPQRFPAQKAIDEAQLPTPEVRQQLRAMIHGRLLLAGYRAIGLDHYALPDDALARAQQDGTMRRNFQGYSTLQGCELVGLGVSAISQLRGCFAQNDTDVDRYLAAVETGRLACVRGYRQTDDDRLRAEIIEAIMCQGEVDFAKLGLRYGDDLAERFEPELQRLRQLAGAGDWLTVGPWGLRVSESGRALLRVVAMVFDRQLQAGDDARRYSSIA